MYFCDISHMNSWMLFIFGIHVVTIYCKSLSKPSKLSHFFSIKFTFVRYPHWPQIMRGICFNPSLSPNYSWIKSMGDNTVLSKFLWCLETLGFKKAYACELIHNDCLRYRLIFVLLWIESYLWAKIWSVLLDCQSPTANMFKVWSCFVNKSMWSQKRSVT